MPVSSRGGGCAGLTVYDTAGAVMRPYTDPAAGAWTTLCLYNRAAAGCFTKHEREGIMNRKNKAAGTVNKTLGLIVIVAVILASPLFGYGLGLASREQRMAAAKAEQTALQPAAQIPTAPATPRPTPPPTPTPVVLPTAPPFPTATPVPAPRPAEHTAGPGGARQ